jgi:hypothetical protein
LRNAIAEQANIPGSTTLNFNSEHRARIPQALQTSPPLFIIPSNQSKKKNRKVRENLASTSTNKELIFYPFSFPFPDLGKSCNFVVTFQPLLGLSC